MELTKIKSGAVWFLLFSGLLIALMSAMESYWEWLAALCSVFGHGCRDAASFTLLKIPLSFWGVGYYLLLLILQRFKKSWMFCCVMAGAGVEIALLHIMQTMNLFCVFCLANACVMLILFFLFLRKDIVWQCVSICLISYILSDYMVVRENIGTQKISEQTAGTSFGNPDAPVTIVEFSDYMCPACRNSHPITNIVKDIYKDKIRWVFRDFPLKQHKGADRLAEAARCAGEQGKFREFQDMLFSAEEYPDIKRLSEFAAKLQLNEAQFTHCVESGKYAPSVRQDILSGKNAGIHSTPTFIIDLQVRRGSLSLGQFKELIDDALTRTNK